MAGEVSPPELGLLLDYAERPRVDDWSLRAALTRYAQPEPKRVGDLLELVRRIEYALRPHLPSIERDGPAVWERLGAAEAAAEKHPLGLLRAMVELDRLGDAVATWAADPRAHERPDELVDRVTADVAGRLDRIGVPREERQRPPRQRG